MIRLALLLALILSGSALHAQTAVYRGRVYTPQNFPRAEWCSCPMCQRIREQWATSRVPSFSITEIPTKTISKSADTLKYRLEVRYRTETYQVKHCDNGRCWFETKTRQVPYQVKVPIEPVAEIPPVDPTPLEVVPLMVDLLDLDQGDVFYDLGSGDGRVVVEAAKRGHMAFGIELVKQHANTAHKAAKAYGGTVYHGDILESKHLTDKATHVSMYLFPDLMEDVVEQLKPGTQIVSYAHEIPGLENEVHRFGEHVIYTAVKPQIRTAPVPLVLAD